MTGNPKPNSAAAYQSVLMFSKYQKIYAKRARGLMTRYAVLNRLTAPEDLKGFDLDGYAFAPEASDEATWVFRRRVA